MASSIGTSWIPNFGPRKKPKATPPPEDAPPPVEPSGGGDRPYLPQVTRPAQPTYMPQIMRAPGYTGVSPYYDPPMNAAAQAPYPGPQGGAAPGPSQVYSPPMQSVTGAGTWMPWVQEAMYEGGAQPGGGVPGAEGGWGSFGTYENWAAGFEAEHGIAPVLEYDQDGNVVGDVKEYWDSQEFLAQYGRPPTMREWKNRYYTGSFLGGGRGYGGGWGGGGGGGGGGEEAPAPQYGWDPGLHWWNYGV